MHPTKIWNCMLHECSLWMLTTYMVAHLDSFQTAFMDFELTPDTLGTCICFSLITARCTLVQSAVLRSHVVCPSVCDVGDCDHIGWNCSKIISRLVSVGRSLSADPNIMDLLQGEQLENWAQSDPPPVDLLMVTDSAMVTMECLQETTIALSIGTIVTPYNLPFPKMGVPYASMISKWPYLRNEWSNTLHVWFKGSVFRVGRSNGAILGYIKSKENFQWPYLRKGSCYPRHVKILFLW